MESFYSRNYLYISDEDQKVIKDCKIIFGGAGIGSNIAESALRLGFENITIIDGDVVDESNLNRQNYTEQNVGQSKVVTLKKRLLEINPKANIKIHNLFLNESNMAKFLTGNDIAINALDFDTNAPQQFDNECNKLKIPVIHPYNLGWAGMLTVIFVNSTNYMNNINKENTISELDFIESAIVDLEKNYENHWIKDILEKYKNSNVKISPPQLSVGSNYVAAMCTTILFKIATNQHIKYFPEFYYSSIF